jgi:hypothetical protein
VAISSPGAGVGRSLSNGPAIFQVKIAILDIEPAIWRRALVPADTTLYELHGVMQAVFGWGDDHLHQYHCPAHQPVQGGDVAHRPGRDSACRQAFEHRHRVTVTAIGRIEDGRGWTWYHSARACRSGYRGLISGSLLVQAATWRGTAVTAPTCQRGTRVYAHVLRVLAPGILDTGARDRS